MEQRDARTLSPLQLDELRSRALSLWKKGFNRRKIGALLDVYYNTVGRWISNYENERPGALRSAKRGRKKGGNRNLTPPQEKEIQKVILYAGSDVIRRRTLGRSRDQPRRLFSGCGSSFSPVLAGLEFR